MATRRPPAAQRGFGSALCARSSLVDVGLIVAVPAALLAVFSLPAAVRSAFVLDYTAPTLTTMYTSHFVHRTPGHLWANVLGYALVVPVTYLLCVLSGQKKLFRVVFVGLLVALPFALSALNLLFVRPRIGYGFSGVVMGYFGFLPLALFRYVETQARVAAAVDRDYSPAFFFFGTVTIAVAIVPVTALGAGIAAIALCICVVYARRLWALSARRSLANLWQTPPGYAEFGGVAALLFFGVPFVAFPADPVGTNTIVDLYTHLLGYALGFMSSYALRLRGGFYFR